MEFQPPPIGSAPLTNGSARPATGEWPAVPPAPTPAKPPTAVVTPEPPLIRAAVRMAPNATDDSPTVAIAAPPASAVAGAPAGAPAVTATRGLREPTRESQIFGQPRHHPHSGELLWQSRFAYVTASVIFVPLVLFTLPLWIVLFRMTDPASNNGAGPRVGSLVALCMMLIGAFVTGAATWMIIVEMRSRVRMVDALARFGETAPYPAPPAFDPTLFDPAQLGPSPGEMNQPVTAPIPATAMPGARPPAARPTELLGSFQSARNAFGQLPAQVALLTIALALFLDATVLSL